MESPAAKKFKVDNKNEFVCGYVHSVSQVKTAFRTANKFFNAVFQVNRDEFHNVVVFAAEKHSTFVQADRNHSPVKLERIKRGVGRDGGEYDIQCGSSTEVSVVANLGFPRKTPPVKYRTIAEVKSMAPKQTVAAVKVKAVHVSSATETLEVRGVPAEMQTCYIADQTGHVKIQLWEAQLGALVSGASYELTNVATRDFGGDLYLTSTRATEVKQVARLTGRNLDVQLTVDEGEVKTVVGHVTGAAVNVCRSCVKCSAPQSEFDGKGKFHCCAKCGLLQRTGSFLPSSQH